MDLNGELAKIAKERGCKFAIGTDAHNKSHLRFLDLGVAMARRGWLTANEVLNSWDVKKVEKAHHQ